ncbi:MAG TPA: 2TM domain-containing protein [Alphaproteobacteria bacterium]|nr:2TM domain-containing protein [Alphaproteobacteria bacterium]
MTDNRPIPEDRRLHHTRRRRRNGFLNHLLAYFGVMVLLVPVNFLLAPGQPWFLLLLVGWGAPLAVHAAWAMELFGKPKA